MQILMSMLRAPLSADEAAQASQVYTHSAGGSLMSDVFQHCYVIDTALDRHNAAGVTLYMYLR